MFDLHSVVLVNFRTYHGTHKFCFPTNVGLYFLTGNNKVEPQLGSNGAGKSTLLDAVTWILFGLTTRKLKASEVITWDGPTSCSGELELTIGGQRSKIKRTQKPNGLFLDDKPLDQEELQKYLRLNFDSFLYSVMNTQFGQSFFALQPSAKLTLFSDIMNLDYWLTKSEEASKLTKEFEVCIEECKNTIARNQGAVEMLVTDIEELRVSEKAFKSLTDKSLLGVKSEIDNVKGEIEAAEAELVLIKSTKSKIIPELKCVAEQATAFEEKRDSFLDKISSVSAKRREFINEQELLKRQYKGLRAIEASCPYCFQDVDQEHKLRFEKIAERENRHLDVMLKNTDAVLEALTKEMIKAKLDFESHERRADELREKSSDLDVRWTKANIQLKALNAKLSSLDKERRDLKSKENPYTTMIENKGVKHRALKKLLADGTKELHEMEADHAAISYWPKGFKRVRLFIIEQAFRTLEIEVNNSLAQLGMSDWQITFDVERENKSGGITKGFVVFVKSPANNEPVRWENWSGGETQRLQLAGDLGLANLIMQQNGLSNTIEFFDEPSTHLSPEGMMDLANTLHERAVSEGKRIWIVDHASITNFGEFEGIITVEKDQNGSRISYDAT